VPPTIPAEYIAAQFPQIHETVKGIEQQGNYKLIFKDCSLDQGFPVAALIIADANKQRYFVKFGAHPVLEIALERCLTEMFQCRDINLNHEMPGFRYYRDTGHPANILKVLRNGYGYYPAKIFSQNFSYRFKGFEDVRRLSNRKKLRYLTGLLSEKGYRILIRDVSFLGFPSYHVLIPGLSEVRGIDADLIEHANQGKEILKTIRDLPHAAGQDIESAISYLVNTGYYQPTDDMSRLLGLPVSNFLPVKLKKHLFISMAYFKLEKYKEAREAMALFLSTNPGALTKPDHVLYKCAGDYLEGLSKGADPKEIREVLGVFYPPDIVTAVASFLANPQNTFARFGVLKCWNCEECSFRGACLYEMLKDLTLKLKEKYADNIVDQNRLGDLFAAG
jgi:ribosomal protein S12 methylthiotransferase accessory factor